jgi:hypothetical protein
MASKEIERQIKRVITYRDEGLITDQEVVARLGDLVNAAEFEELEQHIPAKLRKQVLRIAQDAECLRPESSPFDQFFFHGYYAKLTAALLDGDKENRWGLLSAVCLPSFQAEWALQLLRDSGKNNSLLLSVAESRIWRSGSADVPVRRMQTEVSPELAALLQDAWHKMLLRVRHPEVGTAGLDGVRYHFSFRRMAGQTWSPRERTAPGRLVSLSHLLYQFVEEENGRDRIEDEIRAAAMWFKGLV